MKSFQQAQVRDMKGNTWGSCMEKHTQWIKYEHDEPVVNGHVWGNMLISLFDAW